MAHGKLLQPVDGTGSWRGFGPLFGKENRAWWGTRRWLVQAALWLAVVNGLLAMVLFALPGIMPADNATPGPIRVPLPIRMYRSFMIVSGGKQITLASPNLPNRHPRRVFGPMAAHCVAVSYARKITSPTARFSAPRTRTRSVFRGGSRPITARTLPSAHGSDRR